MLLFNTSRLIWALLSLILGLLPASIRCDESLRNQSLPIKPRASPLTPSGTGPERTVTIVTDTLNLYPEHFGMYYPAHSFVIFGATAQDSPLRVELISPTIDGASYGFAISVIELHGQGIDTGELDHPLPHKTTRTNFRVPVTTRLRNSEILDPNPEPGLDVLVADRVPQPVLRLALGLHANSENSPLSRNKVPRTHSHGFVDALLRDPGFVPALVPDLYLESKLPGALSNARARDLGRSWALSRRKGRLVPEITWHTYVLDTFPGSEILEQLEELHKAIPNDHIFYEGPVVQRQGGPLQPPIAYLFEIDRSTGTGESAYLAHRLSNPWSSLVRALPPALSRNSQSIVSLSRDPRLTSGNFRWAARDSLPQVLKPVYVRPPRTWRQRATPSLTAAQTPSPSLRFRLTRPDSWNGAI